MRKLKSWRERIVLKVLNKLIRSGEAPRWLKSVRPSTGEEDHAGKDVVATTDVGDVYVQVLASNKPRASWWRKHGHRDRIAVVRFGKKLMNEDALVLPLALDAVRRAREEVLVLEELEEL